MSIILRNARMHTATLSHPKIAIATGRYYRPGETFVYRHINQFCGGQTVVVAGQVDKPAPIQVPTFFRGRAVINPVDLISAPWHLWISQRKHSSLRVPFGRHQRALADFLRFHGVQAILCEFGSQAPPMVPIGQALQIPVFCYFRGKDATEALRRPRRVSAYRKLFPQLAGVFAVSQFLLDRLAAVGLSHPNSFVIPSGVDIEAFQPLAKQSKLIVAVGRFVEKKAPHITVEAFLSIADQHPDARLEMIGHGPLLNHCKQLVAKAGKQHQVSFHGQQPHEFVRQRMGAAEIFVQHSVTARNGEAEGLPSSIQEAMACGAAIVSTRHAGIPAIVQSGVTGLLVDEHDRQGFAAQLERILADHALRQSMSQQARTFATAHLDYQKLYQIAEDAIRARVGLAVAG